MKLSKNERKYRSKIIAENHLKKDGQRYLDQYVERKLLTYKIIYVSCEELRALLFGYRLHKVSAAVTKIGTTMIKTANAFQIFAASAARLATIQ